MPIETLNISFESTQNTQYGTKITCTEAREKSYGDFKNVTNIEVWHWKLLTWEGLQETIFTMLFASKGFSVDLTRDYQHMAANQEDSRQSVTRDMAKEQ